MSDQKYFNVPVQLISGFMDNSSDCLNNIFDYAVYQMSLKYEGTEAQNFLKACKWFEVKTGDDMKSIRNGKILNANIIHSSPKVGISLKMWFDFYQNEKSDFDKICFLGFLAIKSILQTKPYCKIDNKYWLSRMDGKVKAISEFRELSKTISKYASEYQTVKIKKELRIGWGLTTYSRYTRGFYVSLSMTIEELVFEAEKRRKSTKDKLYREQEKEALKKAMNRINNN